MVQQDTADDGESNDDKHARRVWSCVECPTRTFTTNRYLIIYIYCNESC
jgi:hypothetical protein